MVVGAIVLSIGPKILLLALLEEVCVPDLLGTLLFLHLHFVQFVHPFGSVLDLVQEPHLLEAVPLVWPIQHVKRTLRLQDHSALFRTRHLIRTVGDLWSVVHVSHLCADLVRVVGIAELRDDLVRIYMSGIGILNCQLLLNREFLLKIQWHRVICAMVLL